MSDAVNEQLSACLDGELPRAELALLLKRVERDAQVRDAMSRYALIGEGLRHEKPVVASREFAAGVMAAIATEPARSAGRVPAAVLRRLRPVAGIAVAAGVAAVAIFTMQPNGTPDTTAAGQIASNQAAPAATIAARDTDPSYVVPAPSTSLAPAFAVPAARLTNYVVAHSEYSSPLGRRSVLTGVLADDDADPMTVVTNETQDDAAGQPQER